MPLTLEEQQAIRRQVETVESRTGAQVVAAVIGKSDAYPEVPWKAFALGAAAGAAAFLLGAWLRPGWLGSAPAPFAALGSLGLGAAAALISVLASPVARWFVDRERAEAEVHQYAEGLFLRHQLFATRRRSCVLLLASEFERRLVILPDAGVRERVGAELQGVVAAMRPELAAGRTAAAFAAGLAALEALLARRGFTVGPDEIAERLVQEEGP